MYSPCAVWCASSIHTQTAVRNSNEMAMKSIYFVRLAFSYLSIFFLLSLHAIVFHFLWNNCDGNLFIEKKNFSKQKSFSSPIYFFWKEKTIADICIWSFFSYWHVCTHCTYLRDRRENPAWGHTFVPFGLMCFVVLLHRTKSSVCVVVLQSIKNWLLWLALQSNTIT